MLNDLLDKFDLDEEQKRLATLGIFGVIALLIIFFYFSMSSKVGDLEKRVSAEKSRMYTFAKTAAEINAAKRTSSVAGSKRRGASLIASINTSSKRYDISLARVNTSNDEKNAQVYLEEAPFDKLVLWLQDLQQGYNIHVENITVSAVRDTPGVVKVNMKVEDMDAK